MLTKKKAFTLIELLVVVLIIGILAAVAVPQYQKAVEKSRAAEALTLLKSVYQTVEAYFLANGEWPREIKKLDIDIPWNGNERWDAGTSQTYSNGKWSLQLALSGDETRQYLSIGRISGKYQGGGFVIFLKHPLAKVPQKTILCAERKSSTDFPFTAGEGAYCQKIMSFGQGISGHGVSQYDLFKQN